jgi:hypothetical protein
VLHTASRRTCGSELFARSRAGPLTSHRVKLHLSTHDGFARIAQLPEEPARARGYRRVAFADNVFSLCVTHQFTRFSFLRARLDYTTLNANVRGQFLFGWTPNPGTAFYVGYNDDLNRNGFSPFTGQFERSFRRNGRTFFLKASYLIRRLL